MNKNKILGVCMLLVLMSYILLKPAHAVTLEKYIGNLSDSYKSFKIPKRTKNRLGRASYKVDFILTGQTVCDSAQCIASGFESNDVVVTISFLGKKSGGAYPAAINNLSHGVSGSGNVVVLNNRISFIIPYVTNDKYSIYDLYATCDGQFFSGKRRIEGTCSTEFSPDPGITVTHRGSFSGYRQ